MSTGPKMRPRRTKNAAMGAKKGHGLGPGRWMPSGIGCATGCRQGHPLCRRAPAPPRSAPGPASRHLPAPCTAASDAAPLAARRPRASPPMANPATAEPGAEQRRVDGQPTAREDERAQDERAADGGDERPWARPRQVDAGRRTGLGAWSRDAAAIDGTGASPDHDHAGEDQQRQPEHRERQQQDERVPVGRDDLAEQVQELGPEVGGLLSRSGHGVRGVAPLRAPGNRAAGPRTRTPSPRPSTISIDDARPVDESPSPWTTR